MGTRAHALRGKRLQGKRKPAVHRRAAGSLADALFTSTQQRVFTLLFGQPNRSFFLAELIGLARSGRGAVQREVARLAEAGLVLTTSVGNQKHFRANSAAPIFSDLRAIVLKTVGLAEPIRTALASAPERIELALIYGSSAKQTDHASSDVDLLIVSERLSLEQVYGLLAPAENVICRKISPTLLTPPEFQQRRHDNSPFLTKVLSSQHIVLVGDINGAASAR